MILSNVRISEWTWTWPNFTHIVDNKDQTGFLVTYINNTCLNRLQHAHNFLCVQSTNVSSSGLINLCSQIANYKWHSYAERPLVVIQPAINFDKGN